MSDPLLARSKQGPKRRNTCLPGAWQSLGMMAWVAFMMAGFLARFNSPPLFNRVAGVEATVAWEQAQQLIPIVGIHNQLTATANQVGTSEKLENGAKKIAPAPLPNADEEPFNDWIRVLQLESQSHSFHQLTFPQEATRLGQNSVVSARISQKTDT